MSTLTPQVMAHTQTLACSTSCNHTFTGYIPSQDRTSSLSKSDQSWNKEHWL